MPTVGLNRARLRAPVSFACIASSLLVVPRPRRLQPRGGTHADFIVPLRGTLMAASEWGFSTSARRYRNLETGRFLAPTSVLATRDDFLARRSSAVRELADSLSRGDITIQRWERSMQAEVRRTFAAEWAFGRGGRNAMTEQDWQAAGELARGQFRYLRGFAEDVQAGKLSAAQIRARAAMYPSAAVQAYETGRAAAFDGLLPHLPAMPGQGTICRANCRCHWSIEEIADAWRCTWVRAASDSCATCEGRAAQWAPLTVFKPVARAA